MWAGVAICMVIIISLWVWSLGDLLNNPQTKEKDEEFLEDLNQAKKDIPTLWQSLTAGAGGVVRSIKDSVSGSQPQESQEPQKLPIE